MGQVYIHWWHIWKLLMEAISWHPPTCIFLPSKFLLNYELYLYYLWGDDGAGAENHFFGCLGHESFFERDPPLEGHPVSSSEFVKEDLSHAGLQQHVQVVAFKGRPAEGGDTSNQALSRNGSDLLKGRS